jgi:hypothetical protein
MTKEKSHGWVLGEHGYGTVLIQNENVLSRVLVTLDEVLEWMIGFIDILDTHNSGLRQYSVIAILHTLQFNVTQALDFSVFTNCILATDL